MILQIFAIVGFLILTVGSEDYCEKWKNHKNIHLVHSDGDCGQEKIFDEISPRIFNGRTAIQGTLPWMAYVVSFYGVNNKWENCGGSVINEYYILTAAHCLMNNPKVLVVLGVHGLNYTEVDKDIRQIYNVSKYIIHPQFEGYGSLKNDIALIRLPRKISFESPYINYICLPIICEISQKTFLGEQLTIAGWGETSTGHSPEFLRKAEVPVVECMEYKVGNSNIVYLPAKSQMCAGNDDVMACSGDSGGPLMYQTNDRVVQVGLLSFGQDCDFEKQNKTDFYSRVSSFMIWILDNIEP